MKKIDGITLKLRIAIAAVCAIILGLFNMLVFLIFKPEWRNATFWFAYAFTMIAFVVVIVCALLIFKKNVETMFFNMPLIQFTGFYLIVAVVVGIIFMVIHVAPPVLAIVIEVLILGAYLVVAILALLARDVVVAVNENVRRKVFDRNAVMVDVQTLAAGCQNAELKNKLNHLTETIKYSDPMTNESVEEVNERIMAKVNELRVYLEAEQIDDAKKACASLELLYIERNNKLKISK